MFLVGIEGWLTAMVCEGSRDTKSLPCDTHAVKTEQERQAPEALGRSQGHCLEGGDLFIPFRHTTKGSKALKWQSKPSRTLTPLPRAEGKGLSPGSGSQRSSWQLLSGSPP